MNIFYLDENPVKAATMLCDQHVIKMTLESVQLMCNAWRHYRGQDFIGIYRPTHVKHPCSLWLTEKSTNVKWLYDHTVSMSGIYFHKSGRFHRSTTLLLTLSDISPMSHEGHSQPPQCMPDEFKHPDTVTAYRSYYRHKAAQFKMRWTYNEKPKWM